MRIEFVKSLHKIAAGDSEVILLTADLGFGVFDDFERLFPGQYINVGVAEQSMTSIAAGMALEGKKVVTYSLGNFPTLRCLEQIRNDACYHDLNITIVASGGGFSYGQLGMSHHTTEDLAIMRALPSVDVCAPCSAFEVSKVFPQLINRKKVGYLRLDKSGVEDLEGGGEIAFGKMRKLCDGVDLTLVAIGGIVGQALSAADILRSKGIDIRVLACHSLKPFDAESVQRACIETGGVITIEEHNLIGGLASAFSEACLHSGIYPKKYGKIGLNDVYSSIVGDQKYLRTKYEMDESAIIKCVKRLVDF